MMGVDLSVRRHRKRGGSLRFLWLILVVGSGLLAWQQGWLHTLSWDTLPHSLHPYLPPAIAEMIALPPPAAPQPTSNSPAVAPDSSSVSAEIETVALVETHILENPDSEAYTAALHLATEKPDPIPWPNIGGRAKVQIYIVQSGDSLWGIANQFELDLDTLRWSNPELERDPDTLAVGTELAILPVQGVYHTVVAGDTVETIAALYGVAAADIAAYPPNGLYPPYSLEAGSRIIVPFGRKDVILPTPVRGSGDNFGWPLVGVVTGGFAADHPALDVGAPYGSTVYAAGAGEVVQAGWLDQNFGYTVIIDHGNEWQTWYAHLKGSLLQEGAFVEQGTPIGEVGSTGHSSGPHVHFEVRLNGVSVNPADYLAAEPQ